MNGKQWLRGRTKVLPNSVCILLVIESVYLDPEQAPVSSLISKLLELQRRELLAGLFDTHMVMVIMITEGIIPALPPHLTIQAQNRHNTTRQTHRSLGTSSESMAPHRD